MMHIPPLVRAPESLLLNRGFILVSPGSRKMSPLYVQRVQEIASNLHAESLSVVLLDRPEQRNQMLLRDLTETQAQTIVQCQVDAWVAELMPRLNQSAEVKRHSELLADPELQSWRDYLWTRYYESGSLRRHCLNQTFQHLQPVLRRFGVTRKNNALVKALSAYVVEELAVLCHLWKQAVFTHEYGPMPQMGIVAAIEAGRYSDLFASVPKPAEYSQIETIPADFRDGWLDEVGNA